MNDDICECDESRVCHICFPDAINPDGSWIDPAWEEERQARILWEQQR